MVKDIGNRIIHLRESKSWSQRELANRIGLNVSVMNRIELGERPIKD
jgi:transcriptional regulator with XRE-family HTH domain